MDDRLFVHAVEFRIAACTNGRLSPLPNTALSPGPPILVTISRISRRHGAARPAIPTASVSAINVIAAERTAVGTPCAATRSTWAAILETTGSSTEWTTGSGG